MEQYIAIKKRLVDAGLHVLDINDGYITIEDPGCVLRGFYNFLEYAWAVLGLIAGALLLGWAFSMIRGVKNDIKENIKNLALIFGILTASGAIVGVIFGEDIMAMACETKHVSVAEVNELLSARTQNAYRDAALYEDIDIYDSGPNGDPLDTWDESEMEFPDISDLLNWTPEIDPSQYAAQYGRANNGQNQGYQQAQIGGAGIPIEVNAGVDITRGAVSVIPSPNTTSVTYVMPNGSRIIKSAGHKAWRLNNPGAVRTSDFMRRHGAIGEYDGFSVFPDMATGRAAQVALLRSNTYRNLTIRQAMAKYAPWTDNNNPDSYAARVASAIGVPQGTVVGNLNDAQMQRMVEAIYRVEGNRPGRIQQVR